MGFAPGDGSVQVSGAEWMEAAEKARAAAAKKAELLKGFNADVEEKTDAFGNVIKEADDKKKDKKKLSGKEKRKLKKKKRKGEIDDDDEDWLAATADSADDGHTIFARHKA